MKKCKTLPLGSVSEGTLRQEDLIQAISSALNNITLSRDDRRELATIIKEEVARAYNPDGEDLDVDREIALEDLFEMADRYVPDFCYFGSHEGDGAMIGVWTSPTLEQDRLDGDIASSRETATADQYFALEVNDHGNMTLWRRRGSRTGKQVNRWTEVWSVV